MGYCLAVRAKSKMDKPTPWFELASDRLSTFTKTILIGDSCANCVKLRPRKLSPLEVFRVYMDDLYFPELDYKTNGATIGLAFGSEFFRFEVCLVSPFAPNALLYNLNSLDMLPLYPF